MSKSRKGHSLSDRGTAAGTSPTARVDVASPVSSHVGAPQTDVPRQATAGQENGLSRLWGSGWGARLVLIGCLLSFLALWGSWGVDASGGGAVPSHGYDPQHANAPVRTIEMRGRVTVSGDNAFATEPLYAFGYTGILIIGVLCCARRRSHGGSVLDWVPLACTAVLLLNVFGDLNRVRAQAAAEQRRYSSNRYEAGGGPQWFIFWQALAGAGGLLFALRKPPRSGADAKA